MTSIYDFIVVGGGVAGCLLADKLARASSQPSVLLIEAGEMPKGETLLSPYDRFTPSFSRPDLDYGYTTTAQPELNDRVIPYLRGKGLGGSSILNFMVYLYGSKEDYDRWAHLVGDDSWGWETTKEMLKEIENFHTSAATAYQKYANPRTEDHGQEGSVDISLPDVLEKGVDVFIDAGVEFGYPRNLDLNSGNPIGIGIFPASYYKGKRTTSATAYLSHAPKNLVVWTNSPVVRINFMGKRATGIELENNVRVKSRKEVIIAAGAFDAAKLLLLSGIGPPSELKIHDIEVIHALPGIGKNLQDHSMVFINIEVDSALSEKYAFESDPVAMQQARELWAKDRTGPLSHHNGAIWGAFLKLPGLNTFEEFKALDWDIQEFLMKPTVPSFEFALSAPMLPPGHKLPSGSSYLSTVVIIMNPQSRGQVTLKSANFKDAPLIDPSYLSHAFDRKAMRDSIKETMNFFQNSELRKYFRGYILGPESITEEHIDNFIRDQVVPVWHANGTVMMGKSSDTHACVDSKFRVFGISNLRVADLSVCPLTANNHPQSVAYLIGQKAAIAIIEEWKL